MEDEKAQRGETFRYQIRKYISILERIILVWTKLEVHIHIQEGPHTSMVSPAWITFAGMRFMKAAI
jgi:hypothetical protein